MADPNVVVIDLGLSNLASMMRAIEFLGLTPQATCEASVISGANVLILPGVGSFGAARSRMRQTGVDDAILECYARRDTVILGVCLGMQLLGLSSAEAQDSSGLGLIPSRADKFVVTSDGSIKVPHVGFNSVQFSDESVLGSGLGSGPDFYFLHSFRMQSLKGTPKCHLTDYGGEFMSAYEDEGIFATQFHPEKSHRNGLKLLSNVLGVARC